MSSSCTVGQVQIHVANVCDSVEKDTYDASYGVTFPGWPCSSTITPPIHTGFELKHRRPASYPVSTRLSSLST